MRKLSPQGFGSAPGAEENGAPEVMEGYQELKKGAVLPNDYPPAMKLTPSGRAVVGFRREQWSENKVTNRWDDLEFAKAMMRGLQPVAISCHRCCPPSKTKDSAQPLRLMQAVEGRISPI